MTSDQAPGDPKHRPRFDVLEVHGNASTEELAVAKEAVSRLLESERKTRATSVWLRSARAHGRRLGMYDYRDRFNSADAWRLSVRFPAGGREYPGLTGRGDAR